MMSSRPSHVPDSVIERIVARLRAAAYECKMIGQVYAEQRIGQAAAEIEAEFLPPPERAEPSSREGLIDALDAHSMSNAEATLVGLRGFLAGWLVDAGMDTERAQRVADEAPVVFVANDDGDRP